MSAYIDPEDLKATLDLAGTTFTDDDLDVAIPAASDALDDELGRSFGLTVDEAGETRYFKCAYPGQVLIDDFQSISELLVDADGDGTYETAWTEGTHFRVEPLNATAKDRPYTTVVALAGYALPTETLATIKVTGMFGWATVPAGIVQATKLIAARLVVRRQSPLGLVMGVEFAAHIARTDPDVQFSIAPYRRDPKLASVQLG